jgi:hypothetical protein
MKWSCRCNLRSIPLLFWGVMCLQTMLSHSLFNQWLRKWSCRCNLQVDPTLLLESVESTKVVMPMQSSDPTLLLESVSRHAISSHSSLGECRVYQSGHTDAIFRLIPLFSWRVSSLPKWSCRCNIWLIPLF